MNLENNKIRKIEGFEDLTNLTGINLSFNMIRVIENMEEFYSLKYLYLDSNEIKSIGNGLELLIDLEYLSIFKNLITNIPMNISKNVFLRRITYDPDVHMSEPIQSFLDKNKVSSTSSIYAYKEYLVINKLEESFICSLERIMSTVVDPHRHILNEIMDDPILNEICKRDLLTLSELNDDLNGYKSMEVLSVVWTIICDNKHSEELKKILIDEIFYMVCQCYRAKILGLVNVLNGFDARVIIKVSDAEEIGNVIVMHNKKNIKHHEKVKLIRVDLKSRGYTDKTIDEWLSYLDQ
jgi:hypothetical protein